VKDYLGTSECRCSAHMAGDSIGEGRGQCHRAFFGRSVCVYLLLAQWSFYVLPGCFFFFFFLHNHRPSLGNVGGGTPGIFLYNARPSAGRMIYEGLELPLGFVNFVGLTYVIREFYVAYVPRATVLAKHCGHGVLHFCSRYLPTSSIVLGRDCSLELNNGGRKKAVVSAI
jgi:hypothetical protein